MKDEIVKFLCTIPMGKKSDKAIRDLVAKHFNGTVVDRYVKIGEDEYFIRKNPDIMPAGYEVRKMIWDHSGNDWRFVYPY